MSILLRSRQKADFTVADNRIKARVEPFGMKYKGDSSYNGNGFARLKTTSPFYGKGMGLI